MNGQSVMSRNTVVTSGESRQHIHNEDRRDPIFMLTVTVCCYMTKIVEYDLYKVPPRWLFLRITTGDGLVGWGEATVEGRVKTVSAAVEELIDQCLLGKDALRIEDHWQMMYRSSYHRGGPILMSAIGGIDQALWDIKGKHYGAPVYELLGGKSRDRIRTYRWIGGNSQAQLREQAENVVNDGWNALKMHATSKLHRIDTPKTIETATHRLAAVRDTVGADVDIAVDCHGRASRSMAKQLIQRLEEYHPMFVEEPLLPEYSYLLADLAEHTTVPFATGERLYSRFAFTPVLSDGGIDVVQPNVCTVGGISETQKIASIAETQDAGIAPTHPDGTISFVSSLHVCLNATNAVILDFGSRSSVVERK